MTLAALLVALPACAAAQSMAPSFALLQADTRSGVSLVELPLGAAADGVALRRPRHALRMRSDVASSAVRSLGLDATECAMLFRMHSRADGTSLVLNPQMHLACHF
jgi:hypothetical protein